MGWAIAGVVVLIVVVLFVGLLVMSGKQLREQEERIKNEGEYLMCWIVQAQDSLYEKSNAPGYGLARVVFSPEEVPDLKKRLKEAARRLKKGDIVDEDADVDKVEAFYEKYKNLKWLDAPLRVPKWLVGDFKVYTASVTVYWKLLPGKKLTLNYIYCWALVGEDGGMVMDKYPGEDDDDQEDEE